MHTTIDLLRAINAAAPVDSQVANFGSELDAAVICGSRCVCASIEDGYAMWTAYAQEDGLWEAVTDTHVEPVVYDSDIERIAAQAASWLPAGSLT